MKKQTFPYSFHLLPETWVCLLIFSDQHRAFGDVHPQRPGFQIAPKTSFVRKQVTRVYEEFWSYVNTKFFLGLPKKIGFQLIPSPPKKNNAMFFAALKKKKNIVFRSPKTSVFEGFLPFPIASPVEVPFEDPRRPANVAHGDHAALAFVHLVLGRGAFGVWEGFGGFLDGLGFLVWYFFGWSVFWRWFSLLFKVFFGWPGVLCSVGCYVTLKLLCC